MGKLICALRKFLCAEDGPTSVEYALMAALIAGVVVATVQVLGTNTAALIEGAAAMFSGF